MSVALLFDVSGSMEGKLPNAREAAEQVLSSLDPARDEAAIFTFDSRLDEVTPFTSGAETLPDIDVHGGRPVRRDVAARRHRADGGARRQARRPAARGGGPHGRQRQREPHDDDRRHRSGDSAIDVPVYIFGIVASIDNPSADMSTTSVDRSSLAGPLSGSGDAGPAVDVFVASAPAQRSMAARQIVDELRHQYLIAFESSGKPGWHPLVVRARNKDLIVRARSGYIAGQSRPEF